MGILNNILGLGGVAQSIGGAIKNTSEVFHVNETAKMEAQENRFQSSLSQFEGEFLMPTNGFDSLINGLNRLPRPFMALGTIGLFIFAMADPTAFSERMQGLSFIPEPLWWLLGAIVGFYFGARELHHFRVPPSQKRVSQQRPVSKSVVVHDEKIDAMASNITQLDFSKVAQSAKTKDNAAIIEWLAKQSL